MSFMECYVRVDLGEETTVAAQLQNLGYEMVVFTFSSRLASKITPDYRKKLENTFDIPFLLALDCEKPKDTKKKGFDRYLQLGTRNKEFFPGVTHVYGNEFEPEKDFVHQRRSGLNHILLAQEKKKGIAVLLDLSLVLEAGVKRQAQLLGRMQQNAKLCRKAGVACGVAVLAPVEKIPQAADVAAFSRLLQ